MKRNDNTPRILGRRVAQELSREDLDTKIGGSLSATHTLRYPPDRDKSDSV